jgi:N-acetylmuramic acid 6-phosphate etherase
METEEQPPQHLWIDKMENMQALEAMLENHEGSISAVKLALNDINLAVNEMFKNLNSYQYTRIIYVGAGTSARIGVQDGTELYPTFGWPKDRVDYIIAGGKSALTQPIENAEDDVLKAKKMFKKLKITDKDVLIGLSASGITPFTLAVINEANNVNALTIGIGNNKGTKLQKIANVGITLQTGYEILAGSTRLKAGTAQKICLNLISTLCMSKLGRIKNGMMSHLVTTNKKLRIRKKYINQII